jgi:hypothetical protein
MYNDIVREGKYLWVVDESTNDMVSVASWTRR